MKEVTKSSLLTYAIAALFGSIGGAITVLIIVLLDMGIHEIWTTVFGINTDVPTRSPGVFLAMGITTLFVSFVIFRYGKANASLESIIEEIQANGKVNWRKLPKALIIAFPSIFAGASLGPEAPSAFASIAFTGFATEKAGANQEHIKHANFAAFSGMLGSILSSPFLAPAMIAETAKTKFETTRAYLTTSMVASAFGIATFFALFGKLNTFDLPNTPYTGSAYWELFAAFIFGIAGCVFVAIASKIIDAVGKVLDKITHSDIIKLCITAAIVSVIMYLVPITMFSGQHTLDDLFNLSLTAGFAVLIGIGFLKLISTALLLRGGFIGGAIFPALFAGAAFGLALNQLFDVSPIVAAGATSVGLLTLMMRQPLSAALLTLLIFGFSSSAAVVCGLAGALLVLSILPKK